MMIAPSHKIRRDYHALCRLLLEGFTEQGIAFYLTPLSNVSIPKSKWHYGKRRLLYEKVYMRRVRALDNSSALVVWPGCIRVMIRQHDLATTNG